MKENNIPTIQAQESMDGRYVIDPFGGKNLCGHIQAKDTVW